MNNPETLLKLVGSRIREVRKLSGLSQEALGEKADLSYSYIGRMENGHKNISLLNLAKIANVLNVSVHEFFSNVSDYETLSENDKLKKEIYLLLNEQDGDALLLAKNILKELFKHK